jgi:hypothetical protein
MAFRFIEEVCQNYDIDGVELDFFRHPVFFKSTSRGEPATEEDIAAMTELLRRIRTMADKIGQKRGRPILIAVKSPDSVEYAKAIGLDLEKWMADDLFDLFIPGGYFQLDEWETNVALGHKHGVKVYASLDEPRAKDEAARAMRSTNLAYRGRAASAWAAGVDGIYLFNFFDPHSPLWRELGDVEGLTKLDKDYIASVRGAENAAGKNLPYAEYQKIETLNPGKTKTIAPGDRMAVRIHIADASEQLKAAKLKLRLQFADPPAAERMSVHLNGTKCDTSRTSGRWLDISGITPVIHPGWNEVRVELSADADNSVKWTDLMLEVRSPASPSN